MMILCEICTLTQEMFVVPLPIHHNHSRKPEKLAQLSHQIENPSSCKTRDLELFTALDKFCCFYDKVFQEN